MSIWVQIALAIGLAVATYGYIRIGLFVGNQQFRREAAEAAAAGQKEMYDLSQKQYDALSAQYQNLVIKHYAVNRRYNELIGKGKVNP